MTKVLDWVWVKNGSVRRLLLAIRLCIASDLFVDHEGRAHLVYFRKGKVAEYAVRPAGETVFGVRSRGRLCEAQWMPRLMPLIP